MGKRRKTVKEVAEAWLEYKRPLVKKSTFAVYHHTLAKHLLPFFGDKSNLSENMIQAFALQKLENGLGMKTVQDIIVVLRMVISHGAKLGWCDKLDFEVRYPAAAEHRKSVEVLSVSDHRKVLSYVESNFTFRNLGIYICLTTGLRIGELCALRWSDIDCERGVVCVRRCLERIYIEESGGWRTIVAEDTPKTGNSCREVPMERRLVGIMKNLKRVVNTEYYVLTNSARPTEPRTYRNYYNRLMEKIGIKKIKFHGLRHSFATRCIESNCDYKTVSVLLGHSNVTTTLNLYVHPNLEQKKHCVERMLKSLRR